MAGLMLETPFCPLYKKLKVILLSLFATFIVTTVAHSQPFNTEQEGETKETFYPTERNENNTQTDIITLEGKAKQYAGFNLSLQCYTNFISYKTEEIGNFKVDEQGNFRLTTHIDDITYAFMDLGILRGYIYLEPGKTYKLILPPYTPKKEADRFNPYFKSENVIIGIENDDAVKLNKDILQFDDEYNFMFNKNAFRLFNKSDVKLADKIVARLDSLFPDNDNNFFNDYKHYRYAKLYMLSMKRQTRRVIYNYYSKHWRCSSKAIESALDNYRCK